MPTSQDLLKLLESSEGEAEGFQEIARRSSLRARSIADLDVASSLERCRSLAGFVREAWHIVEPTTEYVHGWHIDAIYEHLEAVTGRAPR